METVALPLLLKTIPIVLPILLAWIGARWDQLIRSRVKNEKLKGILLHVDDAVLAAVKAVQQTYLDAIEDGLKDGSLSSAEKQEAMRRAIEAAKTQLPPDVLTVLEAMFGKKLDAFLATKIEAAVQDFKRPVLKIDRFHVPGLSRGGL